MAEPTKKCYVCSPNRLVEKIPAYIKRVKEGEIKLMGFGHRVYKNYDPRAQLIKSVANHVFEVTGRNPKIEMALELERIALEDDYFVSRKLYPNVDFYSGTHLRSYGLPARNVHRTVCHSKDRRLAGTVERADGGSGAEDLTTASGLHWSRSA